MESLESSSSKIYRIVKLLIILLLQCQNSKERLANCAYFIPGVPLRLRPPHVRPAVRPLLSDAQPASVAPRPIPLFQRVRGLRVLRARRRVLLRPAGGGREGKLRREGGATGRRRLHRVQGGFESSHTTVYFRSPSPHCRTTLLASTASAAPVASSAPPACPGVTPAHAARANATHSAPPREGYAMRTRSQPPNQPLKDGRMYRVAAPPAAPATACASPVTPAPSAPAATEDSTSIQSAPPARAASRGRSTVS